MVQLLDQNISGGENAAKVLVHVTIAEATKSLQMQCRELRENVRKINEAEVDETLQQTVSELIM